jgi:hypothetical protein
VYPGDARTGEPAIAELRVLSAPEPEEVSAPPPTQPATLYGVPAPGRWCVVVLDGVPLVPLRPVATTVDAPGFTDPSTAFDVDTLLARPVPRPVEIDALGPEDRDTDPYPVRAHTPPALFGYAVMAAIPLALIPPLKLLPTLSFPAALGIAGAVVAGSCWLGWRLYLRPRAAWNGAGIAVVGTVGAARLRWSDVVAVEVGRGAVTVQTEEAGWVLPAPSLPGPLRGTERDVDQLSTALRLARERGPVAPAGLAPPHLAPPRVPVGAYLLWLGWSPVLAWLFQIFSRY